MVALSLAWIPFMGIISSGLYVYIQSVQSYISPPIAAVFLVGVLWIEVKPSERQKCVRCYQLRRDVGSDPRHPELCARCVVNVEGPGEERLFA